MSKNKVETIIRYSPLEVTKIIKVHYKAGVPCNFIAEPSTVKSEGTFQASKLLAEELGRKFAEWNKLSLSEKGEVLSNPKEYFVFADIRASETDIGELRLQDISNGDGYLTFKYNILFKALSSPDAKGVLFFDEMNLAPNMIKAQFYKIINDKAIGDIPISEGVLCVSAGNESEHSRSVTADAVPLVLRRGNYFLRPLTADEYLDYARKNNHQSTIIGYLGFQPQDVHNIVYDVPDSIGQPCPRTWTRLNQILNSNPSLSVKDIELFATGLIGQGVAQKFSAFVKQSKKININEIIAKPELIKSYEKDNDISLMYALISAVVDKFRKDGKVLAHALQMSVHIKRDEFGAFLLRSLKLSDEKLWRSTLSNNDLVKQETIETVIKRYGKYFIGDAE